jgi:DNA-binding transcriptional regulator GbsR (MarR family)
LQNRSKDLLESKQKYKVSVLTETTDGTILNDVTIIIVKVVESEEDMQPGRASDNFDEEGNKLELSPGASQFVENMGMIYERYGVPRIGGRILGLFLLDDVPLSLDDVARLLNVSRASVSTNIRMAEMTGMAKRVSRPGDRRDYYVGVPDMWMQGIRSSKQDGVMQMAEAAKAALSNVPANEVTLRERLQEIIDFTEFFTDRLDQMLVEWEAHRARLYPHRYPKPD